MGLVNNPEIYDRDKARIRNHFDSRYDVKVQGLENLDPSTYGLEDVLTIVVQKHLNLMDIALTAFMDKRAYCPGKVELFCIPFLGTKLQSWGVFPTPKQVERSDKEKVQKLRRAYQTWECALDSALEDGRYLLLFPEGTRNAQYVGDIRPGFLKRTIDYQRKTNQTVLVVPASIILDRRIGVKDPALERWRLWMPKGYDLTINIEQGHLLKDDVIEEKKETQIGLVLASKKITKPKEAANPQGKTFEAEV